MYLMSNVWNFFSQTYVASGNYFQYALRFYLTFFFVQWSNWFQLFSKQQNNMKVLHRSAPWHFRYNCIIKFSPARFKLGNLWLDNFIYFFATCFTYKCYIDTTFESVNEWPSFYRLNTRKIGRLVVSIRLPSQMYPWGIREYS